MAKNRSKSAVNHGADDLPSVALDSYNLELRDQEGFIGDRASNRAFVGILEDWRDRLRQVGDDPLGAQETTEISKRKLDELLASGDLAAAGVVHGAVEEFAQEIAGVLRRFIRAKGWAETERIVVGGGLRESRVGELAIGRASILLKASGIPVTLVPIRHHPDEAGLLGSLHLVPGWTLAGHDGILAVDIGGSNIRAGVVLSKSKAASDLSKAEVWKADLWRHADESPDRTETMARLVSMLEKLAARAEKEKYSLAPFIGVGCPGIIESDGSISRGGQNLPGGNWESSRFNLPRELALAIPFIGGHDTMVLMHNDAVVQGLSEVPFMQDVERWGVVTIGTGFGNARFSNKSAKRASLG